jgi:DNA gyrase subunit A
MKVGEKTGEVVGAVSVQEEDELMLMTSGGQSIRIRVSEVREAGRNTMGVKLLSLKAGEKLKDIARVIPDAENDEPETEPNDTEGSDAGPEGAEE